MKVGIVGNYGNDNQGDEAILEGILIQLEKAYQLKREDIIVFSNNPQQTYEKYGVESVRLYQKKKTAPMKFLYTLIRNKPVVEKLDFLIIGGGGILMDLYMNGLIVFSMYAWLAKRTKTPVIIYGAGAGPIATQMGKVLLKYLTDTAELITVRDPESRRLLETIGANKPIHVIGDPAFQLESSVEQRPLKHNDLQIGVTAVPYFHGSYWPTDDKQKYQDYIQGMARNLDQLLEENAGAQVNFFSTKHPHDTKVTKEIAELMTNKERCEIYDTYLTHSEIIGLSSKMDIVIGTRLHSLILALATRKPIIAVSYHRKVGDFMNLVDCGDETIPINQLNRRDDFFAAAFRDMDMDWEKTLSRFAAVSAEMKQRSDLGVELMKEVFKT